MQQPQTPTTLESVSGSLPVEAALTVIAALVGGPLAPLLPVLAKALASERQRHRVEKYLVEVSRILEEHEEKLRTLSDAQYKLINECILASLQTTQEEKLKYLRAAVLHAFDMNDLDPQQAIMLSRIVRDISVDEAVFVLRNFGYEYILVSPSGVKTTNDPKTCYVLRDSPDALTVFGLLSLGILSPAEPVPDPLLRFTGIVAKLVVLLREKDA